MQPSLLMIRPVRTFLSPLLALLGVACTASSRWVAVVGSGHVVVYDGALTTADTLPITVPGSILALRFAPDGTSLYVASVAADGGRLYRFRRVDGEALGAAMLPGTRLDALWVAPDARSVLAVVGSDTGASVLASLSPDLRRLETVTTLCDGAVRAIAVFERADRLFALCEGDRIADVDLALRTVVRTEVFAEAGSCDATDLAISANGTVLFALCPGNGQLLYLDHRTFAVLDSLSIGLGPVRLERSSDGRRAILPSVDGREIVAAYLRERRTTPMTLPFVPADVALAMDARTAYAVGGPEGTMALVDLSRGEITASAPTPPDPQRVAVWPGPRTPVMRWSH